VTVAMARSLPRPAQDRHGRRCSPGHRGQARAV